MAKELGRPRDRRIDDAVLEATTALLGEVGYAALSVDAIAKQAGTSKGNNVGPVSSRGGGK